MGFWSSGAGTSGLIDAASNVEPATSGDVDVAFSTSALTCFTGSDALMPAAVSWMAATACLIGADYLIVVITFSVAD